MTAYKTTLIKWAWPILNSFLLSAVGGAVTTIGIVALNDRELFSFASSFNIALTLKAFSISVAVNFLPILYAYLKSNPIPEPDEA